MAIGVATLVVVLSIMNGFDREIKTRLLKIVPHITVEASDGVSSNFVNILEDEYEKKVKNMYLVCLHPDKDGYQKIKVPDMQNEIRNLMNNRITSLNT